MLCYRWCSSWSTFSLPLQLPSKHLTSISHHLPDSYCVSQKMFKHRITLTSKWKHSGAQHTNYQNAANLQVCLLRTKITLHSNNYTLKVHARDVSISIRVNRWDLTLQLRTDRSIDSLYETQRQKALVHFLRVGCTFAEPRVDRSRFKFGYGCEVKAFALGTTIYSLFVLDGGFRCLAFTHCYGCGRIWGVKEYLCGISSGKDDSVMWNYSPGRSCSLGLARM